MAPALRTGNPLLDEAWRIALADLAGNIKPYRAGLLAREASVLMAGAGYSTPWTRDAAINAWNGFSFLNPEVSRNTLLSVLEPDFRIAAGTQYWDAIVWATGAWQHYLITGDREFLVIAHRAIANSLNWYEATEFDAAAGLFRGPGWSDGVAAYPDEYVCNGDSAIYHWPACHAHDKVPTGWGIPMKALSTNCLYYNAYQVADAMARLAGETSDWRAKAARLREAINASLWDASAGQYRFLSDSTRQEALGNAYAILFGIAPADHVSGIVRNQPVMPAGVPAVWPDYPRYRRDEQHYSRHAGTVWPQIQGMWAHAALIAGNAEAFAHELFALATHAVRDGQFSELYHPITGAVYGGLQEHGARGIELWKSQPHQSWAASAFVRMILYGVAGIALSQEGIRFAPSLVSGVRSIQIENLRMRNCLVTITGNASVSDALTTIPWSALDAPRLAVTIGD